MRVILVMLVILLILVVIFSVQNPGSVGISFLAWDFSSPLLLVGLVFFGMGLAAGVAGMAPYYWTRRREAKRLRKEVRQERERPPEATPPETEETPAAEASTGESAPRNGPDASAASEPGKSRRTRS